MSLIRNGGFERGNTDFWLVETSGTLEISTYLPRYGSYCGKFISGGSNPEVILSKDYLEVIPYQIVDIMLWAKSSSARSVYLIVKAYNADHSYIQTISGSHKSMNGTYLILNSQCIIPLNTAYIRAGYHILGPAVGEEFYLDGVMLDIFTKDNNISGVITLLSPDDYSSSGDTHTDAKDMKQFSTYYAQLSCTYASGTTPTLDVEVYEEDAFEGSILLGTFTQITTESDECIDLPHCLGNQMYLKYTIGGTSATFNFGVSVVGKG